MEGHFEEFATGADEDVDKALVVFTPLEVMGGNAADELVPAETGAVCVGN